MLNPQKVRLARAFETTGLSRAMIALQARAAMPFVRVVNYHAVERSYVQNFERQLEFYREHFVPVRYADLVALRAGRWPHDKPGLLISFDDAEPSHYDPVAPLLEQHGFVGWFFVPVNYVDHASGKSFVAQDSRVPRALTWDQVRELAARGHVVGCHTFSHVRLAATLSESEIQREIIESKARLEQELGREVTTFCWVGGEEWSYSEAAAKAVKRAGYELSFMTNNAVVRPGFDPLQIQRTNIEAFYPLELVRFQLSGFLDLMYLPKRRRVNRLTAT